MIFEAGYETREKIWCAFGAEQKWRAERKEWFLFIPLFLREREILKAVFLQLLMVMRFDYDIEVVLGSFW